MLSLKERPKNIHVILLNNLLKVTVNLKKTWFPQVFAKNYIFVSSPINPDAPTCSMSHTNCWPMCKNRHHRRDATSQRRDGCWRQERFLKAAFIFLWCESWRASGWVVGEGEPFVHWIKRSLASNHKWYQPSEWVYWSCLLPWHWRCTPCQCRSTARDATCDLRVLGFPLSGVHLVCLKKNVTPNAVALKCRSDLWSSRYVHRQTYSFPFHILSRWKHKLQCILLEFYVTLVRMWRRRSVQCLF